jgi:hypothetical protein
MSMKTIPVWNDNSGTMGRELLRHYRRNPWRGSPTHLALADVLLADDRVLRQVLHDYFAWATTTTMCRGVSASHAGHEITLYRAPLTFTNNL